MATAVEPPTQTGNPIAPVLRNRNFRLLWIGQGTSLLGDQFSMIAMPWLVLQLTHDPLALGTVLALGGIPEAVLALVGGAFTDRFSARTIMLLSDGIRLLLSILLAALTFTGSIQLWMLYAFALLYGTVAGMFYPASGAMIPMLVERDKLQAANSVWQGTMQLTMLIGPALAGSFIAAFGNTSANGIAFAFACDALSFLVSVVTLWLLIVPRLDKGAADANASVIAAIKAGLSFAWHDPLLRLLFTVIIANNLILGGTWSVGIPVLADSRLSGGAAAFGLVWAALRAVTCWASSCPARCGDSCDPVTLAFSPSPFLALAHLP